MYLFYFIFFYKCPSRCELVCKMSATFVFHTVKLQSALSKTLLIDILANLQLLYNSSMQCEQCSIFVAAGLAIWAIILISGENSNWHMTQKQQQ